MVASGQNEEEKLLLEENIILEGPFWYSVSCLKVSCPGLTLEVDNNEEIYLINDNHQLEWGGYLQSGAVVSLFSSSEITLQDIQINKIIRNNLSEIEEYDLIDSIPSPGNQGSFQEIKTEDNCTLGVCESSLKQNHRFTEFIGVLENNSDKDSIQIYGEPGDAIVISNITGSSNLRMEVWYRNNTVKDLVINELQLTENLLEFPKESELWIRIVSSLNEGMHPYKLDIYRNNQSMEFGNSGELQVPWNNGEPLSYEKSWYYESYLVKSDYDGDSIQFEIGADMKSSLQCSTSSDSVYFNIYLVNHSGIIENITSEDGSCPNTIETNGDTFSVEIVIKSSETIRWNISFSPLRPFDGTKFSDAPESRWVDVPDERWDELLLDSEISGSLHSGDNIDIYLIRIYDNNGSRVYLNEVIKTEVNYTIQEIDQESGKLVNTSNGEVIVLPIGNHTLRIERRAAPEISVNYAFKLEYLGVYEAPLIEDYEDLSWMFNNFYVLIGVLMLTPLMVVLFWNRGILLRDRNSSMKMKMHEKKKLIRIRDRISKEINKNINNEKIIDSALVQLGESPWRYINEIWGEPELSHRTEEIELSAWKASDKDKVLLLGLKTSKLDWDVASIKFNYPEGKRLSIVNVSNNFLTKEDEIFLNRLSKNSQIFLRISLEGESATLALELSGLVEERPMAATPFKVIKWD